MHPRTRAPDPVVEWPEVIAAVGGAQATDRAVARERLGALWERADLPAQRCVIAHFLADVQESLHSEVAWDEAAWAAFQGVSDADLEPIGVPAAAGFAPSLHLNLGDGYLRQERREDAARELALARAAVGSLDDDGYGAMVRRGLDGLQSRLAGLPDEVLP